MNFEHASLGLCGTIEGEHINSLHQKVEELQHEIEKLYGILQANNINYYECAHCGAIYDDKVYVVNLFYPFINSVGRNGIYLNKAKKFYCYHCFDFTESEDDTVMDLIAYWLIHYSKYKLLPPKNNLEQQNIKQWKNFLEDRCKKLQL